jgi:hypothetical protein
MRKVGILSDEYHYKNCIENMPLRVGLAQQLFPYERNVLTGVKLPKDLPVSQRGYEMSRVAYDLSKRTNSPYEQILGMLKDESRRIKLEELRNITTSVKVSNKQESFLAKSIKPRQSNFSQLSRAYVSPTGNVMPKTGMLTKEELSTESSYQSGGNFSKPSGALMPPEERY